MDTSTLVESSPAGVAARLGALADPARLAIVGTLADGERCVCDLQERVPMAPNLLSYHLRVLREAGLVVATRRGRWIDYRLDSAGFSGLWAGASAAGIPLPGETVSTQRVGPSCDDGEAPP